MVVQSCETAVNAPLPGKLPNEKLSRGIDRDGIVHRASNDFGAQLSAQGSRTC
jgi:hypothetical protein